MINHSVSTNFLRHIFSESVSDLANISVAEAEGDYDVIIGYLERLQGYIGKWINELKEEKNNDYH